MSTTVAKQFSDFASKRDFRLGESPSWQRSGSQGATKVYAKMREASYRANAPLIRNRRLAQSIGYDPNYALNVKMNREISDRHFTDAMTAHTTDATEKLKGLRSHITPVFTNTHGALSSFQAPGLVGSLQKGDGWDGSGVKAVANNAASTIQSGFRKRRATVKVKGARSSARDGAFKGRLDRLHRGRTVDSWRRRTKAEPEMQMTTSQSLPYTPPAYGGLVLWHQRTTPSGAHSNGSKQGGCFDPFESTR